MWALDQPCAPRAGRLFADTPLALLAVLALGAATTWALVELGVLAAARDARRRRDRRPRCAARHRVRVGARALGIGRGGGRARSGWPRRWPRSALFGALAYLGPPLWVAWLARRGRLAGLGLGAPVSLRSVLTGAGAGAFLSSHLLVSASRTLGVHVRLDHMPEVLAAVGYDVGANVLAAECFFRGALFNRAQRRWSFAAAATVATASYVVRYLVDPLLPKSIELVVGAVFYLALLGAINCWLLWWSESLVPGLLSALVFFAAYRTLGSRMSLVAAGARGRHGADRARRRRPGLALPSRVPRAGRRGRAALRRARRGARRRRGRPAERAVRPPRDRAVGPHRPTRRKGW